MSVWSATGALGLVLCGLPGLIHTNSVRGGARFVLLQSLDGAWAMSLGDAAPAAKVTVDFNYESTHGLGWSHTVVTKASPQVRDAGGWASVASPPEDLDARVAEWAAAGVAKYDELPPNERTQRLEADGITDHHVTFLKMVRDGTIDRFQGRAMFLAQHVAASVSAIVLVGAVAIGVRATSRRAGVDRSIERWRRRQCPACGHALPAPIPRRCPACDCSIDAHLQAAMAELGPQSTAAINLLLAARERAAEASSGATRSPAAPTSSGVVVEQVSPPQTH